MTQKTFRALFCQEFHCPDSEYEKRALRKCLYRRAIFFGPFLRIFKPDLFSRDIEFMRQLGEMSTRWEAQGQLVSFQNFNREEGFLRKKMKMRVSGQRAANLAAALITKEK